MKAGILTTIFMLGVVIFSSAQVITVDSASFDPLYSTTALQLSKKSENLTIGAYAEIDYNQPIKKDTRSNGLLDVHRMVTLIGYRFNDKLQFSSEIEYEHVKELYVEQAFINYNFNTLVNVRGGLMLVPMGIINEFHEPTTFNGVERPEVDGKIVPTTWREMGIGITGNFSSLSLKYQAYIFNGFASYNGQGLLNGKDGLRKGRQKGAESFVSSPNFSFKFDYYGVPGLKIGAASYVGKTQSSLYDNLDINDNFAVSTADSSVVNVAMSGMDFRYKKGPFSARGQYILTYLGNTVQYNGFTGSDLGNKMTGYYVEGGYDLISMFEVQTDKKLVAFIRYENFDTQNSVDENTVKDINNNRSTITSGLSFTMAPGAVLKGDFQFKSNQAGVNYQQLNLGIGIWF